MQIPDSINNLTNDAGSADPIIARDSNIEYNDKAINDIIRKNLSFYDVEAFDEGRAFYKRDIFSDKGILKNLIQLYGELICKAILTSSVQDDYKVQAQKTVNDAVKAITSSIDTLTILDSLNKRNIFLDAKRFSCILLGYAIDALKKTYHT